MPIHPLGFKMKKPRFLLWGSVIFLSAWVICPFAEASVGEDISYLTQGTSKLLGSAFAIPKAMLQDSGRVMFPFGIVTGACRGTIQTVTGILGGAFDLVRGAAPYAKYAALAL